MPSLTGQLRACGVAALTSVLLITAAVAADPSSAAAKAYDGPDVASYQHPSGHAINWQKVKKAGKEFAIVKATEGTGYTNPYFASDYAGMQKAGLVRGSYHFARPATPVVSNAVAQAKHYAAVIGGVRTTRTLPPALDLEVTGGLSRGQLITWAQTFLLEMHSLTDRVPMLYTYPAFWSSDLGDPGAFERFPLWMAHYGTSTAPAAALWQFTDDAHIKGIVGGVDESKFLGSSTEWATMSNGTTATPWVPAAPAAPIDVHGRPADRQVTVSWLPSDAGTSPITSYTVTTSPGGEAVSVSGSRTSATVTGLKDGQSYRFTVTAANDVGRSQSSADSAAVVPVLQTSLATTASATSVIYGKAVTLRATLTQSNNDEPLAGRHVLVYRRKHQVGSWTKSATLTTNSSGRVSKVVRPGRDDDYELVFPGATGLARADNFITVLVRPAVTANAAAASIRSGTVATISGSVTPFAARETVRRQIDEGGTWRTVATTKLSKHGNYRFRFRLKDKQVDVYRVVAPARAGLSPGYSRHVQIAVS